ncbi:MAG: hypothetical protein ACE5R6_09940 [Candidatus Heimdallarchaeota archaeon]
MNSVLFSSTVIPQTGSVAMHFVSDNSTSCGFQVVDSYKYVSISDMSSEEILRNGLARDIKVCLKKTYRFLIWKNGDPTRTPEFPLAPNSPLGAKQKSSH